MSSHENTNAERRTHLRWLITMWFVLQMWHVNGTFACANKINETVHTNSQQYNYEPMFTCRTQHIRSLRELCDLWAAIVERMSYYLIVQSLRAE